MSESNNPGVQQALLVIDVQVGLVRGVNAVPEAGALTERIATLVANARRAGALIVHLQNDGAAGAADEPGTPGWELALPVQDRAGELVIRKTSDDGFHQTGLAAVLAEQDARCIAVCGLLSEMCVSATARTALARGFEVTMPHDTHATYDIPEAPGLSDRVPAAMVSRVAEWALGDQIHIVPHATDLDFTAPIHRA